MTRKRYIKLMMAAGLSRNEAEHIVSLGKNEQGQVLSDRMKKHKFAHRGCWPCDTYDELLNFWMPICLDVIARP
jgi:hypothetical protein